MALTATTQSIGGSDTLVKITGSTVGVAEGVELTGIPRKCRVIRHKAVASGGTVTTIQTILTRDQNDLTGTGVELRATPIGSDTSPALPLNIDVQPLNPTKVLTNTDPRASSGSLFYFPQPDQSDGGLIAEFLFRGGWE